MATLNQLEKEIILIKKRNKRVEADKAWETSMFRRVIIAVMTYIVVVLFMWIIDVQDFWLNALVPTAGFMLSTLSLPFIKKWWINR
ncbi:hypothetical protein KY330_03970 [Candidatus Woesearchaeota archaeon]|nr:hypothetical protein [Candidatus Woesearchaeota archaeon]